MYIINTSYAYRIRPVYVSSLIMVLCCAGMLHAQPVSRSADTTARASDSISAPYQWSILNGFSIDNIHSSGPHTFSQSSDNGTTCVRTGYAGEAVHAGWNLGLGYGPFSLRLRYSDLSSSLDTIQYEFRTLGLEFGYTYRPLKDIPVLDGLGIIGTFTLDTRINNFTEGFGSNRVERSEAPRFVPSIGIGLDYQFRIAGIEIGPEYQFRKSWTNLAGGDDITEWFHSIGAKVKAFFGSEAPPPEVKNLTYSMQFLTNSNMFCDYYYIPYAYYSSEGSLLKKYIDGCRHGDWLLGSEWQRISEGTLARLNDGAYVIIAVSQSTDAKHCYFYSDPQKVLFNGTLSSYRFDLTNKKCNCQ